MIQATGGIETQWILDLCNGIVKEGTIPGDWKSSVVLPIYKGKGDPVWILQRDQIVGTCYERYASPYILLMCAGKRALKWVCACVYILLMSEIA